MSEKKSGKIDRIVIIILAFVFILGLYELGSGELEIDEYFSLHISQHPISDILMLNNNYGYWYMNNLPPFYEFFLNLWARISGNSVLAYRFPSVIFNVIFILFVFKMGKLLADRNTGYISATLASFTLGFVFYSRFLRSYALLNMLVIISFYIAFKMLEKSRLNIKDIGAITGINTIIIYTHYLGFLVLLLQTLLIVIFWRQKKNRYWGMLYAVIIPFVFYVPWFKYFFIHMLKENIAQQRYYSSAYIERLYTILGKGIFGEKAIILIYLGVLLYVGCGYLFKNKSKEDNLFISKKLPALIFILATAILLINFVNTDMRIFRIKYFLAYMFPLFIISGYGIQKLPKKYSVILFASLLILSGRELHNFYNNSKTKWQNPQLKKLISSVRPYEKAGMTIFIEDAMYLPLFVYYYWNPGLAYKMSTPRYGYNVNAFLEKIKSPVRICANVRGPLKIDGVVKGGGNDFAIWRWTKAIELALDGRWFLVLGTRGAKDFFDKTDEEIEKENDQDRIKIKFTKEFRARGYLGRLYEIISQ
ncbi:MAG: glycosyltransferase family 39 protein [Candidatus Omnitrophota bacterium]